MLIRRGVTRRHERGARDAMDVRLWRKTSGAARGRRSRTVLTPRRRRQARGRFPRATESTRPGLRGDYEGNRNTIAQGMLWRKSINKINGKTGVCPPLCRDPQKLLIAVKNSSAGR
jgi:hypothetical protein